MEVRELKTLLALMQDFGLVELEIEDKKGKVRLVRAGVASAIEAPAAASHRSVVGQSTRRPKEPQMRAWMKNRLTKSIVVGAMASNSASTLSFRFTVIWCA